MSPLDPENRRQARIFTVGLTGSLGAGKSTVAHLLQDSGFTVVDADGLAKKLFEASSMRIQLQESFGSEMIDAKGEVDRNALARIVFENPEKRKLLNSLVHPGVRRLYNETKDSLPDGSVLVYDVPLLFEAGLEKEFDLIVVVNADLEERYRRVSRRNNWSREEFLAREKSQMSPAEKEARADVLIRNDSSGEDLEKKVHELIVTIRLRQESGEKRH